MEDVTPDQLILALDVDTAKEALQWARRLKSRVGTFKVGLQLYLRAGGEVLAGLQAMEAPIFLDLKFHDIPNTVGQAVAAVADWRPRFLTIHASGGRGMIEAAVAAAPPETKVLGITLLTSLAEADLSAAGWRGGVDETVECLSDLGREAGLPLEFGPQEQKRMTKLDQKLWPKQFAKVPVGSWWGDPSCEHQTLRKSLISF